MSVGASTWDQHLVCMVVPKIAKFSFMQIIGLSIKLSEFFLFKFIGAFLLAIKFMLIV